MADEWNLPDDITLAKQVLSAKDRLEQKKMDLGKLGLLWGSSRSVPNNIAALTIVVLITLGVICTIVVLLQATPSFSIKDLWAIITPFITLAFGFLFSEGVNSK